MTEVNVRLDLGGKQNTGLLSWPRLLSLVDKTGPTLCNTKHSIPLEGLRR
jgi:hypothetical protein